MSPHPRGLPRIPSIACMLLASIVLAFAGATGAHSAAGRAGEVRALWVARTTLGAPATIARMVEAARASGFNTLFVQVRARGDAYYAGRVEPRAQTLAGQAASFDPLETTLAEARRAGLAVHAWINVNLVSSAADLPASRAHIVYRHPEWLMVPCGIAASMSRVDPRTPRYLAALARAARQQSAEVEGLFMSPVDPDASGYLARLIGDIAARYAVDGIHLDYARYPSEDFDCSPRALALFAAEIDETLPAAERRRLRARTTGQPLAYVERFPERWTEFRRERLTALVARVRAAVKTHRRDAWLTAAVIPDAREASERRFQDWRRWAADGLLDAVCPMAYSTDGATFAAQVQAARQAAGARPLWAGIAAYRLSPAQTIESIQTARRLGAAGVVLFSYDGLVGSSSNGAALVRIGRAAFDRP